MKRRVKKLICNSLCMMGIFSMLFSGALSADAASKTVNGVLSNNIHDGEYYSRAAVSMSAMVNNNDGTISRVESFGDIILVERYNAKLTLIEQKFLNMELPIYGGCFSGANVNYVLFGNENYSNDKKKETVRVVVYSKNWQRLGAASLYGCNTQVPFEGCNVDLSECGEATYVRMGHRTYEGVDTTLTFGFNSSNFYVFDILCSDPDTKKSVFRDSAATFIDVSDGSVVVADHSLVDPYACMVSKFDSGVGVSFSEKKVFKNTALALGDGTAVLGGVAAASQYYLLAGSASPQDGTSTNNNIFIAAVPKNTFEGSAEIGYLTGFAYGDGYTANAPYLVKIDGDHFVVIWECTKGYAETETVNYAYIDGAGNLRAEVQSMEGCLSDCKPVLCGNNIYWYTTNGVSMKINSIPSMPVTKTGRTAEASEAVVYKGVDYSMVYDFNYYVNSYSAIRVLYQNDPSGALRHFVEYGMKEGRKACENFDPAVYKANYADVRNAYGNDWKSYYIHFMKAGYAEGRNARTYKK